MEDSNGQVFENNNEFTMLYNAGLIPVEARWQMKPFRRKLYRWRRYTDWEGIMLAQGQGSFDVLHSAGRGNLSGLLNVDPAQVEQGETWASA